MPGLKDFQTYQFNPRSVTSSAAAYTVLTTDEWLIMTGATARIFTLPGLNTLSSLTVKHKRYKFTNNGTANLTIDGGLHSVSGADQTIGGKTILTVRPGLSVILVGHPNATDWEIVSPTPFPDALEQSIVLVGTTSGTTAVNLVDADGAPCDMTILTVVAVAQDTNAGNITVVNGTDTVVTIAKSATASLPVGEAALTYPKVTKGNILTIASSTTNGNAKVIVYAAGQSYS
jgi:hypothetical protein